MAFTLAYHIILVPLGVAFPLLTVVMEGIGLRRNDPVALRLARRWPVVMAVPFAVGAGGGPGLSFAFGLLWARLCGCVWDVLWPGFCPCGARCFSAAYRQRIPVFRWLE